MQEGGVQGGGVQEGGMQEGGLRALAGGPSAGLHSAQWGLPLLEVCELLY